MPFAAWAIALALGLSPALTAGLVLVGASPGGTASNVVCYLARGDLALSITLTTASTLLAVVATPLLTWLYVGQQVPVPVFDMLFSIFKIVLLPVVLGVAVNSLAGRRLEPVKQFFPLLSVAAIVFIIAIVVALNRDNLAQTGILVALAVVLHNAVGLAAGYWFGLRFTGDPRIARTLAIEVGMQNSGLAVALAVKYFSAAAALPGALFSIWHNLSGSTLAAVWSRRSAEAGGALRGEPTSLIGSANLAVGAAPLPATGAWDSFFAASVGDKRRHTMKCPNTHKKSAAGAALFWATLLSEVRARGFK